MRRLVQLVIAIGIILFTVQITSAQEALIRELAGTVELLRPDSEIWEMASAGQVLAVDTVISTGFRSTVLLAVGNSLISVRPLTRLSISELSRLQDTEKVELNLTSGRIRAEVIIQEESKTDFTIRSAYATSSVRGTDFEFDTINLSVSEGTVEFTGLNGFPILVDAVGFMTLDERARRAAISKAAVEAKLKPLLPTNSDLVIPAENATGASGTELITTVTM